MINIFFCNKYKIISNRYEKETRYINNISKILMNYQTSKLA